MVRPRKADALTRDLEDGEFVAERLAAGLLASLIETDPVEAVCALAMVTSHLIVTVATEGESNLPMHERLQPGVQRALLDRITELCQDTRASGAN